MDGWRRRYPTHVGDVAGACVALAELRRQHAAVGVRRGPGGGGGGGVGGGKVGGGGGGFEGRVGWL